MSNPSHDLPQQPITAEAVHDWRHAATQKHLDLHVLARRTIAQSPTL